MKTKSILFAILFLIPVLCSGQDSTDYKSYISLKEKILIDKDKEGVSKVQYHRYEGAIMVLDYFINEELRKFQLNIVK